MGQERKWLEFSVGLFLIIGIFCLAYLSISLGHFGIGNARYDVKALFPTVSGLKDRAPVTMAGVDIGEVKEIKLKDDRAEVVLSINKDVKIEEDSIASIKTTGIIGDKYVSITPGASDTYLNNGGTIHETQPPLDIESLISHFVFGSMESKKSDESGEKESPEQKPGPPEQKPDL